MEEIDDASLLEKMKVRPEIDTVIYTPGAHIGLLISKIYPKRLMIAGTEMYKKMTIRNVNTVRKIHALMLEVKAAEPTVMSTESRVRREPSC